MRIENFENMLKEYGASGIDTQDQEERVELLAKHKHSIIAEGLFDELENADEWIILNIGEDKVRNIYYGKVDYDYGYCEYFFDKEDDALNFSNAISDIYTYFSDGYSKTDGTQNFVKYQRNNKTKASPDQVKVDNLTPTSQMIDEEQFWNVIHESLKLIPTQDQQLDFLITELEKLPLADIIGFKLRTDKLLYDSYTSEMWCAAYMLNGGCSDDGFDYFRGWLISRGKKVYYEALKNPDTLINEVISRSFNYNFESFSYAALNAFENITGNELDDYIDHENFRTHEGKYQKWEFNWSEEHPESMKALCPKLYEKFWKSAQEKIQELTDNGPASRMFPPSRPDRTWPMPIDYTKKSPVKNPHLKPWWKFW
jgi:hypothetical protein